MLDGKTRNKALSVLQEFPMMFDTLCAAYERAQLLSVRNRTWNVGRLKFRAQECTDVTRNMENVFELTVPMLEDNGVQCHEFTIVFDQGELMLPLPLQHPLGYQSDANVDDPFFGSQLAAAAETMALAAEIRDEIEKLKWIVFPCEAKIIHNSEEESCEVTVKAYHSDGGYVEFVLARQGEGYSFRISPRKMDNGSAGRSVTFFQGDRKIFLEEVITALGWCQVLGFEKAFVDGWSTLAD